MLGGGFVLRLQSFESIQEGPIWRRILLQGIFFRLESLVSPPHPTVPHIVRALAVAVAFIPWPAVLPFIMCLMMEYSRNGSFTGTHNVRGVHKE